MIGGGQLCAGREVFQIQLPLLSCTVSNVAFTLCSKIPPTLPNSVLTVGSKRSARAQRVGTLRNIAHRKVRHTVIFDAFPCSSLVHEVLHYVFSSTECSVVYAGFLVRVLFEVHLCGSLVLPFCVMC